MVLVQVQRRSVLAVPKYQELLSISEFKRLAIDKHTAAKEGQPSSAEGQRKHSLVQVRVHLVVCTSYRAPSDTAGDRKSVV